MTKAEAVIKAFADGRSFRGGEIDVAEFTERLKAILDAFEGELMANFTRGEGTVQPSTGSARSKRHHWKRG